MLRGDRGLARTEPITGTTLTHLQIQDHQVQLGRLLTAKAEVQGGK